MEALIILFTIFILFDLFFIEDKDNEEDYDE